jgi:hypothetical protein
MAAIRQARCLSRYGKSCGDMPTATIEQALNYIQTVLLGGCDQFVALAAGVEPQLRWFASGNFGQRFRPIAGGR